ncbi:hypothetical transmembrane protein [Nonlabens ulvanivorans]|uniref:Hypothetical transmembrane protein n=1 Tax=Nonlabens ulvanivorans TaxID=906888 RepID=A0A081DFZ1_NONUL|nr:hypothetical protein [Nonlabens ulvanivorans]GAK77837.1 hypothetical transmembrane protein [Nonlabens ulvanivorans]
MKGLGTIITIWDKIVVLLYLLSGLLLFVTYYYALLPIAVIHKLFVAFGIGWSFMLYGLFYKKLKQPFIVTSFIEFSIIQIIIYVSFKNESIFFDRIGGTYLSTLLFLPAMLISYHLFNLLNRFIYKDDLIITGPGNRLGQHQNGRKIRTLDFVFSFAGALLFLFGVTILF